jgi:hypothetical protein
VGEKGRGRERKGARNRKGMGGEVGGQRRGWQGRIYELYHLHKRASAYDSNTVRRKCS